MGRIPLLLRWERKILVKAYARGYVCEYLGLDKKKQKVDKLSLNIYFMEEIEGQVPLEMSRVRKCARRCREKRISFYGK